MMVEQALPVRYSRLANTRTFRDDVLHRWLDASVFVFGAGNVGQRVATECLLAGVRSLTICDFDWTRDENLGTQFGERGSRKIDTILSWAESSARGNVVGLFCDARHVGIGQIAGADVLIDCTDDPRLALPLTNISNGLGIPLLRPALDGSGESEMGRVACSHGGGGHACQLCTYEVRDLFRHTERTPCQPIGRANRRSTLAGGAIGATVAGITVLQAQRLVTCNDVEKVVDHEWIVDLSNGQLLPIRRCRSPNCLSGHVRWNLTQLPHRAAETTWRDLFAEAQSRCGSSGITLEPYSHAICVEAICECGHRRRAVGTRWAPAPACDGCGQEMRWVAESCRHRITLEDTAERHFADEVLADTGIPETGAMFVARSRGQPPLRLVLS